MEGLLRKGQPFVLGATERLRVVRLPSETGATDCAIGATPWDRRKRSLILQLGKNLEPSRNLITRKNWQFSGIFLYSQIVQCPQKGPKLILDHWITSDFWPAAYPNRADSHSVRHAAIGMRYGKYQAASAAVSAFISSSPCSGPGVKRSRSVPRGTVG